LNDPSLAEFDRFLLPPGAGFGDLRQWWDDRPRRIPHEGVDLCWYRKRGGEIARLLPGTRLPAMATCRVVRIVEDFLGHSIFVIHKGQDAGRIPLSVYGHATSSLKPGEEVREGGLLATIAQPGSGSGLVLPHIHLSMVWLPAAFPFDRLDWRLLHAFPEASFCDPLPLLSCPWEEIPAPPSDGYP
jgi:hypothetical protein